MGGGLSVLRIIECLIIDVFIVFYSLLYALFLKAKSIFLLGFNKFVRILPLELMNLGGMINRELNNFFMNFIKSKKYETNNCYALYFYDY